MQTSDYTVLTIPDGVDPERVARDFQSERHERIRGGLLGGIDATVHVTRRVGLTPGVQFVYGGPAQVGNRHRELGAGVRGFWAF